MKPFNVLLVGAVIWGVTPALAFISGIAVGNSQEVAAPASSVAQPIGADGQQGQFDPAARDEFRQRVQSGEATQEEIDQFARDSNKAAASAASLAGNGQADRKGLHPAQAQGQEQAPTRRPESTAVKSRR